MRLGQLLGPDILEIAQEDPASLKDGLRDFHPADVADLMMAMPREDRIRVADVLDDATIGQVLPYLPGGALRASLVRLSPARLGKALDTLEADDQARLLSYLPEEKRIPVLAAMSAADAAVARGLLTYAEGTAGRLMTSAFVKLRPDWTVAEALEHLKKIDPEVATVADLYVVNDAGKLVGVVSLRKLLPAVATRRVSSLMARDVISVRPDAAQLEVSQIVSKYGFNALPVVDDEGRALGIITVDDVVDFLVERENQAALRMGGVVARETEEPGGFDYFSASIVSVVKSRIGWLLLLFVAETLTGTVLRHFEHELAKVVALSFFIPLIIGTGGNAGSQTVSTIIRALALGQVRFRDALRVLVRETSSGLLLGVLLCVVAFGRSLLWGNGAQLSLVVGLTILAVCAWANVIAAVVPLLAQKLRIDPTVVSAPLITTLVDATGLAIYMLIAKIVLKL